MARPLGLRNPRIARLRQLAQRRAMRRDEGAFVIEGPTLIDDALDAALTITDVFVAEGLDADGDQAGVEASRAVARRAASAQIPVWAVPAKTLTRAVDVVTPRPVAAIAEIPTARADLASADLVVVLDRIADPGNAGTILRLAEASGVGSVVFGGAAVDPFGPKCVRASAGSVFRVPITTLADCGDALDALCTAGHAVIATSADAPTVYDQLDYTGPVAFVLGNEAHGVDAELADHISAAVSIPMAGRTESLNVAMAGAVLCFEAARQRRAAGEGARG